MTFNAFSKIATTAFGAGFIALAASGASAQSAAVPTADNPFGIPENFTVYGAENPNQRSATVIVNGYVITGTDIDQRVALVTNASQNEVTPEELQRLRMQILQNLIDETLKIQAAQAQEMAVEQTEVNQTYDQLAAQNFGSNPERMDEYLRSIGSSPDALKRQIAGEQAWDNLLRRNVTPFVNISADEVNEVLARQEASRGQFEYRLGEIYMSATLENRAQVEANVQQIMQQLQAGGSFTAYARQYSEASTAVVGGDTGFLRLGTLPQAMQDAVLQMQVGQLFGPIEIPGGFTIIYLIDRKQILMADPRDAVLSLKQISINFPEGTTVEDANARIAAFEQFIGTLGGCEDASRAETEFGATVRDVDNFPLRQAQPQLQQLLLSLQPGQSSPAFGSLNEGAGVFMLCGREEPVDAGAPDFATIEGQIRNERINKRAQRYLRDLRNDAYIQFN